ncbi:MAG: hypothetical protein KC592_12025 [Nitrospira sp.]|nr:hypothetical protein [Nitrospira sp.]
MKFIMPLTLCLTEGVIPTETEKQTVACINDSMLKCLGLTGNTIMTPNITATVHMLPKGSTHSSGADFAAAWSEWIGPSFSLSSKEIQIGYFKKRHPHHSRSISWKQPKDTIYVNVIHAVDGAWNLAGKAMINEELGQVISQG